ncbi:MAG TPA: NUDIX domain-containing protein [Pyrinomonadaceae bacterium]|nr:NUDIX domain-containing protein [Pyrinomonadaceae bacterium]
MIETESAGGIVLDRRGRVLVVSQHGTSWSLPKGHVEAGEDKLSAARREIREESGVTRLELLADLGSYTRHRLSPAGTDDPSELKTIHLFLFRTDEHELQPSDPDNPEARWVEPRDVPALLTHAADREFFAKHCPRTDEEPAAPASDKAGD